MKETAEPNAGKKAKGLPQGPVLLTVRLLEKASESLQTLNKVLEIVELLGKGVADHMGKGVVHLLVGIAVFLFMIVLVLLQTADPGFQFIKYSGFYILVCHSQDILSVFFRNRAPV